MRHGMVCGRGTVRSAVQVYAPLKAFACVCGWVQAGLLDQRSTFEKTVILHPAHLLYYSVSSV